MITYDKALQQKPKYKFVVNFENEFQLMEKCVYVSCIYIMENHTTLNCFIRCHWHLK